MFSFKRFGDSINRHLDSFKEKLAGSHEEQDHSLSPSIKFIGTNLEENTNYYSIMVVCGESRPVLHLSHGSIVEGPIALDTFRKYHFWRFDIEMPLEDDEFIFTYSLRDQSYEVAVPGKNQAYKLAFFSCNGFSSDVSKEEADRLNGIQPLWKDLMRDHDCERFHGMIGGGDQLYADTVLEVPSLHTWLTDMDKDEKLSAEWTDEMNEQVASYYFEAYATHFGEEGFAKALACIPFNFVWDDHDIFDGYGSYPSYLQESNVFQGIFRHAKRFYLLFQHHNSTESINSTSYDRYISADSITSVRQYGAELAVLSLDVRSERCLESIIPRCTWDRIIRDLEKLPDSTKHLVVSATIPLAYPRLPGEVLFDHASKVMNFTADFLEALDKINPFGKDTLADNFKKTGAFKNIVNSFGEPELMDDLNDHWTSESHEEERNHFISELQKICESKRIRVSFVSGDVHVCGAAKFESSSECAPESDHRYMLQIVSSAMGNIAPPDAVISSLHLFSKEIEFDDDTVENMVEIFHDDLEGNETDHKYLMNARNWSKMKMDDSKSLKFHINVEKCAGDENGYTKSYSLTTPALE